MIIDAIIHPLSKSSITSNNEKNIVCFSTYAKKALNFDMYEKESFTYTQKSS